MKQYALVLGIGMLSGWAHAQDGVYLGNPGYAGTGCRPGTADAILSPDATALSILFSDYVALAGRNYGRQLDRRNCSIGVPVFVPQGFSVSVIKIDYRGFNSLPRGARSTINAEYFFAGSRGPSFIRTFYGPQDSDYLFINNLVASAVVWSPCGAQVILRANTSVVAQSNSAGNDTMSTVDSADVSAALIYRLQWRKCRM